MTDRELWACAQHYVKKHADDAPIIVAMRADELFSDGDLDGAKAYRGIVRRINQLLDPPEGRPS